MYCFVSNPPNIVVTFVITFQFLGIKIEKPAARHVISRIFSPEDKLESTRFMFTAEAIIVNLPPLKFFVLIFLL